jgi:hypothetical protein
VDLAVPADADYVFNLISPDSERRAAAVARDAALVEDFQRALARHNELWFIAGKSWQPKDAAVHAAMDQARAAMSAAKSRTLHGIAGKFIDARRLGGPDDHERLAPYAVLFLRWENTYPDQWRGARASGAPWRRRKHVLRRFIRGGVPAHVRGDVIELVAQAIAREHRCEDGGFAALARLVNGAELHSTLIAAEAADDPLIRLRAQYVRWVVDHPAAPVTTAGWRRWLASDERP